MKATTTMTDKDKVVLLFILFPWWDLVGPCQYFPGDLDVGDYSVLFSLLLTHGA